MTSGQFRRNGRFRISLIELLIAIACIVLLLALLTPARSKLPRTYYQGKDQFHWMKQLEHPNPEKRQFAVLALSEMLKEKKCWSRSSIVNQLGSKGAEARTALPALERLVHEDEELRRVAVAAIKNIDPPAYDQLPQAWKELLKD